MKLQQLRFLIAVVDNGLNITSAADALYTSQPGVSKQIRMLEEELELKLFVRKGKRIEALTPAGEQVLERARLVLSEVESMKTLADELRGEKTGELVLATTQTQARYVLPRVISRFREQFPAINFHVHQGTSEQIARMIDAHRVDFAMASSVSGRDVANEFDNLVTLPIYQWDRVILVPASHPLVEQSAALSLEAVSEYPLVTYLLSDRPESSLMTAFKARRLRPRVAFTARDADVIKTYVRTGVGVGVLASMAVEPGTDDDLVGLDATGLFPRLTTWLGFPRDLLLTRYHCDFIRLLAPHFDEPTIQEICRHSDPPALDQLLERIEVPLRNGPMVGA